MDSDKLASTNQVLHDLERKLSLVSTSSSTQTAQSHGSVVQDPTYSGLARKNIQSSVLQYIKDNKSEFDADRVFSDRQHKFATTFTREYSPSHSTSVLPEKPKNTKELEKTAFLDDLRHPTNTISTDSPADSPHQVAGFVPTSNDLHEFSSSYASDDYADYFDDEFGSDDEIDLQNEAVDGTSTPPMFGHDSDDSDDDMLLPPSPPRSPPREMDPNKLYGLFDFSGPDPSHCTLQRDEPVYLLNDSDNYWWLIRKLSKDERQLLWYDRGERDTVESDHEDGKIGFVPAECLETYGERLARLNCFKNEELERFSRETLPTSDAVSRVSLHESLNSYSTDRKRDSEQPSRSSMGTLTLGRSSSILRKAGEYGQSNKSVTFENLGDIHLDEDDCYPDDVIDFSDNYYSVSHEDVAGDKFNDGDSEKHSEVLSDTYSAEAPLQIRKPRTNNSLEPSGFKDFAQPKFVFSGDNASIGSFSPDTPSTEQFPKMGSQDKDENESKLRRSLILDRLNIVTSGIQAQTGKPNDTSDEPTFGGSLGSHRASDEDSDGSQYEPFFADQFKRRATGVANLSNNHIYDENEASDDQYSRKSLSVEEVNTPLTSVNSLNCVPASPKPPAVAVEKRKQRPFHDSFMPILGQLDELTERLAELEHIL